MTNFNLELADTLKYKTLITQDMLTEGILAANSVYVSVKHTPEVIDNYFEKLDPIFSKIKDCEQGDDINNYLVGKVCHSTFSRLN